MPNTSGTSASVTTAMRSVSQSRRGGGVASPSPRRSRRGRRPVALRAAQQPCEEEQRRDQRGRSGRGRPSSAVSTRARAASPTRRCGGGAAPSRTLRRRLPRAGGRRTRGTPRASTCRATTTRRTRGRRPPRATPAVSLVSSSMRSPMPRSLKATDVKAASGTRHATVTAAMPIRLRIRADGALRSAPASTAAPNRIRSTIISSTRAPKSPATASLAVERLEGLREGVLRERPRARRQRPCRAGSSSTGRLRSRSGTSTNHATAPTAAAAAAPRDCVSSIATTETPIAGYASTRRIGLPVAARAKPEADRNGDRRDAADRVPVVERLSQPVRDLVLGERPGPYARGERVDAPG